MPNTKFLRQKGVTVKTNKAIQWECEPQFFRLSDPTDETKFYELLDKTSEIILYDEMQSQLEELAKISNPAKHYSKEQLSQMAKDHLGTTDLFEYGVWVYYPWLKKMVHLLDEKEFIQVRTSRNMYKITVEERDLLAKKKIGIIGLSIGQSVAATMCMERSFGEVRLADFDMLELTNLNRLRTGVYNLGVSKVIIAAREIAEIDPFLKVVCFSQGLTEANMEDFFLQGGKLDMLIEECDSVDIKILSRLKAKELKIPVVMDTSDRGMLDVERFDLQPDRPILHGLIDHLDVTKLKELKTNEEKIPYLLPMVGVETISTRLKASAMEVGKSITTWPQLATSVVLGGAITADVCRRIMLGSFHESGRYFVDVEQLVVDTTPHTHGEKEREIITPPPLLTDEEMLSIVSTINLPKEKGQIEPERETIVEICKAAVLAPSGGNSQPWKWMYKSGRLFLFYDKARSMVLLDFEDVASYIALGAAAENVVLKSHAFRLQVKILRFPLAKEKKLVAVFTFFDAVNSVKNIEPAVVDFLTDAIPIRLTNRKIAKRVSLAPAILTHLQEIASTIEGAQLHFLESDKELSGLAEIISKAEKLRLMHPRGHADFVNEIRWTKQENEKLRDGIDLATLDISPSELAGLQLAKDWRAIEYLKKWKGGAAFESMSKKTIDAASAVGFITMPRHTPLDFFEGGRAVQRVWLASNQKSISFQPQSPITFLFARLLHGNGEELPPESIRELKNLRQQFEKLFPLKDKQGEIFLFRLCMADVLPVKSLRRPVEQVLTFA